MKAKCFKSFFTIVVANGSLNPDPFFLDNVHLLEKGNLKLAESIFSSLENCNGVTCNKKKFLISYKMAVSFKLNNFDFPPLYLLLLYLSLFSLFLLRHHLLMHVDLPVMLVLSPINLSLIQPTSLMMLFAQCSSK